MVHKFVPSLSVCLVSPVSVTIKQLGAVRARATPVTILCLHLDQLGNAIVKMPETNTTLEMQKCVFALKLPRKPMIGDEIIVKGVLCDDAQRFSVNFCFPDPAQIVYHFGMHLDGRGVVQCSRNDTWDEEHWSEWEWEHSGDTPNFTLIFRFGFDEIKAFLDHTQQQPQFELEHRYPIEQIHYVELWDDIARVEEITLRYANPSD